jgi:hypothetical protein
MYPTSLNDRSNSSKENRTAKGVFISLIWPSCVLVPLISSEQMNDCLLCASRDLTCMIKISVISSEHPGIFFKDSGDELVPLPSVRVVAGPCFAVVQSEPCSVWCRAHATLPSPKELLAFARRQEISLNVQGARRGEVATWVGEVQRSTVDHVCSGQACSNCSSEFAASTYDR